LSDSYRFKEKVETAKGEVELKIWKKMWHIFHMQASFVPESSKALVELCSYIKQK
jgi:acetyl esterase/lipase